MMDMARGAVTEQNMQELAPVLAAAKHVDGLLPWQIAWLDGAGRFLACEPDDQEGMQQALRDLAYAMDLAPDGAR